MAKWHTRQTSACRLLDALRSSDFIRQVRACSAPFLKRLPPPSALFDEGHEVLILKNLRFLPNSLRYRQSEERSHIPAQSFLFDYQFVLERLIHAARMKDDQVYERVLFRSDGLFYDIG